MVAQKNSEVDDPKEQDIYSYGCLGKILQLLKLPDGTVKVLVEGVERVKIKSIKSEEKSEKCMLLREKLNFFKISAPTVRIDPQLPARQWTTAPYSRPAVDRQPGHRRGDREEVGRKTP